jgi:hypothetical protein
MQARLHVSGRRSADKGKKGENLGLVNQNLLIGMAASFKGKLVPPAIRPKVKVEGFINSKRA